MNELKQIDIASLWNSLEWASGRLVLKARKGEPLEVSEAPKVAGLYRVTWDGLDDWNRLPSHIMVMASRRITDSRLSIQHLQPPVLLTIGRTTEIYGRIREHLGTNENNNRLFTRLKRLLANLRDDEIRHLAMRNLVVEWVAVPTWSHRCLLERYGSVVSMPLFDIDAEH